MRKNVFILALTKLQRAELETIQGIGDVVFHGLLDVDTLVEPDELHFDQLLDQCRQQLQAFPDSIDGIIAHWDFPSSVLAPILCREYRLPSPSLESVLKCEHKYWSRVEQQQVIPDCIPGFASFDPFDDQALEKIKLDYPFWIKPVKSHSSQLGFLIENAQQFAAAMTRVREKIGFIGHAFDEALAHAQVPEAIQAASGTTCIAEEIIGGTQSAPEGSVFNQQVRVHGMFDMFKDKAGKSFESLVYPSTLPPPVQQRMRDACEQFLNHIGFDNGCFNVEFMWDQDRDKLWVIEFNTRISQSHSEMFIKVDGQSNHKIAVDLALGREPSMPHGSGDFNVAAKFQINYYGEDAIIARVPDAGEIQALKERFPKTEIEIGAEVGDRLSELPNQDAYSYHLGDIYLGADDHDQLQEKFHACRDSLRFQMQPLDQAKHQRHSRSSP